ncbi:MAG: NADPH:quinone oxidoreductase family protein [Geodermatophilaceae bacterium]|nr:NADPH:quinone oxidoreductase family protein [Geodermatophilaceae bacterium]
MRAWRVHELGEPADVLALDDVPDPVPGEGQLLVRVQTAALNFPDILLCQGRYQERPPLPFTPGIELTGEVVTAPDGSGFRPGDRVLGGPTPMGGAFAEYAVLRAADAFTVPPGMPSEEAAALYLTYQTGHVGLHRRARLQAGETLLVHAGAGGVGSAAIQLGKAAGATVIATAGGPEKVQVCRDLGADHAIDYVSEDFVALGKDITGGRGADVIYDPVGGDVFDSSRRCLAWEGRLIVVGFTSGRIPEAPANHALIKNYSIVGLHWGLYRSKEPALITSVHEDLTRLYAEGRIRPFVSERFAFDELPEALTRLGSRRTVGKVVLVVAQV